ncbi:flavin reductase family protein [Streptomyces sp. NBC_00669]|uniref:flavin reductase family protein n=1 Tax=unclassified Streptomyces TaxID=2593676 RepID=UPI002E364927|nr:flavin reductase family protein [Streptomyces sp. NBC_00669]
MTAETVAGTASGTASDTAPGTADVPSIPEQFRTAFRGHPAGVVVVTVPGAGRPAGFTATSVASLSLDPALLSFGISGTASSWPHLRDSATAVVHFLAAEHEHLARRFATSGIDRFAAPTRFSTLPGGEPVLDDVSNWLLVDIEARVPAGDHRLVIGRVTRAHVGVQQRPLLYHDGRYHTL